MNRRLAALLIAVWILAFIGYEYDFSATSFLERKFYHRWRDRTERPKPNLFDAMELALKVPDSQDHRLVRVKKVCQKYRDRLHRPHYMGQKSNFFPDNLLPRYCSTGKCPLLVDLKQKVLFCFIQKVASTTIKSIFLPEDFLEQHLSRDNVTKLHKQANDKLLRVGPEFYSLQKLKTFYKVMFVRHPFERLVSVYDDKVGREPSEIPYFYDNYFKMFAAKKNISGTLSFSDFADYLIETPPFEYNEHWMPYYYRCEPCLIEYDFIGKLETADGDFTEIFSNAKLEGLRGKLKHLNKRNSSDVMNVEEYFIQLERNQIMALYKIYRFDFELFGYNIVNYIDVFDNMI